MNEFNFMHRVIWEQLNLCGKPKERPSHKSTLQSATLLATCSLELE